MADQLWRKYASTNIIFFDLFNPGDGHGEESATFTAGDVHVHINGASTGDNAKNLPTAEEGMLYKWKPGSSEMTGEQTIVRIIDQGTSTEKVWLDKTIIIEMYGDTSALHRVDFSPTDKFMEVDVQKVLGSTINALQSGRVDASVGVMAANVLSSSAIAANAITNAKLKAGAITAGKIAANAITSSEIAAGTISAGKIKANAITSSEVASGTLTAAKLASNAITAAKINAGALTAAKLAANVITSSAIAAGSILAGKVAANTITSSAVSTGVRDKLVETALDATIADAISTDGDRPSLRKAALMTNRYLFERVVVGTTMTVLKEDGASTSMRFELDSSTAPTSHTRTK